MSLDARVVLVVGGLLCWILAAAIEFQAVRPNGRRTAPDAWSLALLAKGLGLLLVSQRGLIANVWSIALAHALLLAGVLLFYVALQRIRGAATNRFLLMAMPVSLGLLLPMIGLAEDDFALRVLVIMSAWLFGFSLSCWSAVQIARTGYLVGAALILVANGTLAVVAAFFGFAVAVNDVPGLFAGSPIELAFYTLNDVCIAVSTFGYMAILRIARAQLRKL